MKPDPRFTKLPKSSWATVRSVSQCCGYTERGTGKVKIPSPKQISKAFEKIGLDPTALDTDVIGKSLLTLLCEYFEYRAHSLNEQVKPLLMDAGQSKQEFQALKRKLKPTCPLPMNKQRGKKKAPAYLTCIVNMLIEAHARGYPVNYDPRALTTVTQNGAPLRTLARRVDGAFPSPINPKALWEIKEYYHTTTFGSRVAGGVYETLLDGMEIEELQLSENIQVLHYLFLDARYTWWECGRSYLCRIVDMVQMGYVDEVLVGREVIERLPELVESWVDSMR